MEAGDSDSDSEDGEAVEAKHDSWGGVLAELDDTESSSSEESDISGIEDQMGDLLLNEDAKISGENNVTLPCDEIDNLVRARLMMKSSA